jgi:hypothetical protein
LVPTSEASLPVNRAAGPGGTVRTVPLCARGALLACAASEPSSSGSEELDISTIFKDAAVRAFYKESLRFELPVVPPFPLDGDIIQPLGSPASQNGQDGVGGRGNNIKPGFPLGEWGR